ncbi:helix-turn-helix domain-containing protein [Salegentibacter mishustinae]|uniref:helix-turn-helix domain-containing protein n=1 Tax=Salegentibacter mishustinae TaxID=270918 RepID=UPI001CE149C0|nr:helix-turn-helix transcriptional regulator [Salegentibacter mishustinae]UBZ08259.1 helix-turn-helix domain-containing protein [Salegentibacter mishustinae]
MENLGEKDFLIAFGKNLRRIRKAQGFTQAQLANDIGVEISQISRIERGIINTSISNCNEISKALNTSILELFKFPN